MIFCMLGRSAADTTWYGHQLGKERDLVQETEAERVQRDVVADVGIEVAAPWPPS